MGLRSSRLLCALAGVALLTACATPPGPPPPLPPVPPASPPAPTLPPSPPCEQILWIEIQKSARRLDASCLGGGRASFTVALGRQPVGPKRSKGDHRTPEGRYHVVGRARPSRFHRFLAIDYPSRADAERARDEGRLSESEFRRIAAAHGAGLPPPADTVLGGLVGFHGEGARWRGDSAHLDWTDGCLAMTDDAIDFLAARTAPGTPVRILP